MFCNSQAVTIVTISSPHERVENCAETLPDRLALNDPHYKFQIFNCFPESWDPVSGEVLQALEKLTLPFHFASP